MKKALIVTALAGFVRSFLTNDIKILQEMGYEVYCASNKNHPGSEGIEEYFINNDVKFLNIDFSSNKPISKETLISYKQIKKISNELHFDLVHCHTPIAGAITRWIFRKRRKNGTKVIYTTHGFYFHKKSGKKSWIVFNTIERVMSKYSDAIITINNEDYYNAKKMHCDKVYKINGVGVDIKKFKNTDINIKEYRKKIGVLEDEIMILNIGELSKRKNQQIIIKAIAKLKNEKIIFVHCGNAMNKNNTIQELLQLAQKNNVKIRLLGLRKDIPEICKCANMGTLSSTREGLGLAGIEMIASGLPIVASNVHGIVDYVKDGVNGFLANPFNDEDFKEKIKLCLNRVWDSRKISQSVENFDISVSNQQIKNIYEELLN